MFLILHNNDLSLVKFEPHVPIKKTLSYTS